MARMPDLEFVPGSIDKIECAHVRLKGAVDRLKLLLDYESRRNYEAGFRALERSIAEYRELTKEGVNG